MASRSNWPSETLGQFLIRSKRIEPAQLQLAIKELNEEGKPVPLGDWLVQKKLLAGADMASILEAHFRDRLFNLLSLSHGQLKFDPLQELSLKDIDVARLPENFSRMLMDAVRMQFDEKISRAKLSGASSPLVKLKGDCTLPLSPKELRVWNDLCKDYLELKNAEPEQLRLLALASEFEQIEMGKSPQEKLMLELKDFQKNSEGKKFHEILGISIDAAADELQKAYLQFVKKYHPDRLPPDSSPDLRKLSESVFMKINEAHSTMNDPQKRAEYKANIELEAAGGREAIERTLEAEMLIPQAKMALRRRHYKPALEMLEKIIVALPKDPEILADHTFAQVMCLVESKASYKEALYTSLHILGESLKKRADYGLAYYYRAVLWKIDGQTEHAINDFEAAFRLDSSLNEAASELRLLKSRKEAAPAKKSSGWFGKKS